MVMFKKKIWVIKGSLVKAIGLGLSYDDFNSAFAVKKQVKEISFLTYLE